MSTKVLVFNTGSLGDTLALVPALKFIRKSNPRSLVYFLSDSPIDANYLTPRQILDDTGLVDQFIEFKSMKAGLTSLFSLIKIFVLLFGRFRVIYYLQETWLYTPRYFRDYLFFRLLCARSLVGFGTLAMRPSVGERVERRATEALRRVGMSVENIQKMLDRLYQLPKPTKPSYPGLSDLDYSNKYILGLFSNMPSKNWPVPRYLEVARYLRKKYNLEPILLGPDRDNKPSEKFLLETGFGINLCGLDFDDVKYTISRCKLYVGNDSGLMHLSSIYQLPCIAIFSARDFVGRWEPIGANSFSHRRAPSCAGCHLITCPISLSCLTEISVEDVVATINRLLQT